MADKFSLSYKIALLGAAREVCKEPGVKYKFVCPICKSPFAEAEKDHYGGKVSACCKHCGTRI